MVVVSGGQARGGGNGKRGRRGEIGWWVMCEGVRLAGATMIVSHIVLAPVEAPAGYRRDGCPFISPSAGNCVGLLVGGMRTVTAHAADQSPRTDPSHWRDTGTPDLFGHRRK